MRIQVFVKEETEEGWWWDGGTTCPGRTGKQEFWNLGLSFPGQESSIGLLWNQKRILGG